MSMDYYNPADLDAEDLIKRVRVGQKTQEFLRTPVGLTIVERAINQYKDGIVSLQEISIQPRVSSSEEELKQYRAISDNLATPLKILYWLDAIITDGDNAEAIAKYKDAGML
jgi:hypothetical protein